VENTWLAVLEEIHISARLGQIGAFGLCPPAREDEDSIGVAAEGVEAGLDVFDEGLGFAFLEGGDQPAVLDVGGAEGGGFGLADPDGVATDYD
jgi:hypothetical protein